MLFSRMFFLSSLLLMPLAAAAQEEADASGLGLETCELLVPGTPLSTVGQCGWLSMPENPAEPDGRHIEIRVARIPARGRVAEPRRSHRK